MKTRKTTFGGGWVSPKISAHLAKPAPRKSQKSEIGGGWLPPRVKSHLAQATRRGK